MDPDYFARADGAGRKIRRRWSGSLLVLSIIMPASYGVAFAQVTLDGSLGRSGAVQGPNHVIDAGLGRRTSQNLFFSFDQFNLSQGESATFTGPASIANVISRVTGGKASSIDGLIDTRSSMPSANFFLINPNGVIFGPNARLNIGGSFHSSTADYIRFGDDQKFFASLSTNSMFTVAEPVAFGFLGPSTKTISILGGDLRVDSGKTLSFIGGAPQLVAGTLQAPDGMIQLIAAHIGEIPLSPIDTAARLNLGPIQVSKTVTTLDEHPTTPVVIRSGQLLLDGASIDSTLSRDTSAPYAAIDIQVTGTFTLTNEGKIATSTPDASLGRSGDIVVEADHFDLNASASLKSTTVSGARGGDIQIKTTTLSVDNAAISTFAFGTGIGGDVSIRTGSGTLRSASITSQNAGTGTQSGGKLSLHADGALHSRLLLWSASSTPGALAAISM
jgi:filamentous hemagglutinin family protein